MEWKKLSQLVERKICYGIVQPGKGKNGNIPVIKVNNIISGLKSITELDTTTHEIASKFQRTQLFGGEIVVSVVGSVGNTAIVPSSFKGCNLVRATAMVDIKDKVLATYVMYYFKTHEAQKYIESRLNTTVQATLNIKDLEEMPIPILQSSIILRLVSILSALDAKIENNNKINANLEAQAQALFKSWFVDFTPFKDQPFVDSELGPIPQGWKVGTLGEFFPIVTGKKDANISSKSGKYPFFSCSQNISWTNDYSFDGFAIIVAGNGDFNVKWYNGKFEAYQRTYVLIPYNPTLTSWLYYAVKYNLNMITIGARGSVIKFITKGDIQNFKVAYPQNIDKHEIVKMLGKINKDIEHNKNEVSCLAKLRDTLLPKLMSGEIKL